MGTRNLTMVKLNNKTKVAQYCQWDGYPTGVGSDIADFIQKELIRNNRLDEFKNKVDKLKWMSSKEADKLWEMAKNKKKQCPELHRDTGPNILNLILNDRFT